MEFKLQRELADGQAVEKTEILDTKNGPVLNLLGDMPPAPVEDSSSKTSSPWTQGFSRINLGDSMVIPQTGSPKMSGLASLASPENIKKIIFLGIGTLFISVGGFVAYDSVVNGVDPMDHVNEVFAFITGSPLTEPTDQTFDQEPMAVNRSGLTPVPDAPEIPAQPMPKPGVGSVQEGLNPYWGLMNDLPPLPESQVRRKVTPEEEVSWANALKHEYPYQRYRAVLEIRQNKLSGSEPLLWYALYDKKLWIRMRALMALAEIGTKVSLGHVKMALGSDPDMRIAHFFKRFIGHAAPSDLYIMRHAIRLVPERSRLVILQALEKNRDSMRNMYMAAASLDTGRHVQHWLKENYIIFDMNGAHYNQYIAAITGSTGLPQTIIDGKRKDGMPRPARPKTVPTGALQSPETANPIKLNEPGATPAAAAIPASTPAAIPPAVTPEAEPSSPAGSMSTDSIPPPAQPAEMTNATEAEPSEENVDEYIDNSFEDF